MSHSSMLKNRRKKQATKKQLRRAQKLARRERFAGKVARVLSNAHEKQVSSAGESPAGFGR